MKIVEHIGNILKVGPYNIKRFEHNPMFDMVLLMDVCGCEPELVLAKNGHWYIYFEKLDWRAVDLAHQMGLSPRRHKSRKYVPARYIYRIRINDKMPACAYEVANQMWEHCRGDWFVAKQKINTLKASQDYADYITRYKLNQKTK